MKLLTLFIIILFSSCENHKATIAERLQSINEEMDRVKVAYFAKVDSLQAANKADTFSSGLNEELTALETKKTATLLSLQKEYNSLSKELMKK